MSVSNRLESDIAKLISGNILYTDLESRWKYFYQSFLGGDDYREAGHLVRYQNETDKEYQARLYATPLENHCASVVSVYNSFLFRESPERDLGNMKNLPEVAEFIEDADLDGRSLEQFMSDINVWMSVFGHAWIIMAKPNVGAVTMAQQRAMGVRPYLSSMTPLAVLDWSYTRNIIGRYTLDYFRYVEDINGSILTVKEWTKDVVRTVVIDKDKAAQLDETIDTNELGIIPAVCAYNQRTGYRGIGKSDLADISDLQRFIYNATSEVDQSIRLNTHPSLVKTQNTQAGIGAGSVINMDEAMDPALKPYLLEFNGASVESIYTAIEHAVSAIDKIANTGAVRATESRVMSGVAMETEFQLLNSKLSSKANSMELVEEQLWDIFAAYQGRIWDGKIDYPGSFNIKDTKTEIEQLKIAKEAATDPLVIREIDKQILHWLEVTMDNEVETDLDNPEPHDMINPNTGDVQTVTTNARHEELMDQGYIMRGDSVEE